ncbi:hypothetical protein [Couchioplanes azureus]|uniref:hypothetical protein n=1 Tax=Couchioplanes caeruleus TaxID=56438 RepID=UPI0016707E72|nr:hypothetical protein [Couchioplanes caeruleus]GGQ82251.1 hypothetical protein GCM10010166_60430 [Couchioplanes caeruleus subsp. azureus]
MNLRTLRDRIGGNRVVVQIIAIVAGATLTFFAGWRYSDAASAWQEAIRVEVARSGVYQDDTRQVYANEGPFAFRVAATQIRADVLAPLADTNPAARTQHQIAAQTAFAVRKAADPGTLLGEPKYALPGGGSNLHLRLADVTAAREPTPNPDIPRREGDALARLAGWTALLTAVITGLAVIGACVRTPRRRRSARSRNFTPDPLKFYEQPGEATGEESRIALVLLAIWAAGVLLPLTQLVFSSQEQRYQAESARHTVQARSVKSLSLTRTEFLTTAHQTAQEGSIAATAREIDAVYKDSRSVAEAGELARAEETAAGRSAALADIMARIPPSAGGVEKELTTALASGADDWNSLAVRSAEETRKADSASLKSNITLALIGLVALSEVVVHLVSTRRRRRSG